MVDLKALNQIYTKLSKREKTVLYVTAVVLSVTLADRLIISPIIDSIKNLNVSIADKETEIRKSMRILSYKEVIDADGKKYGALMQSQKTEDEEITSILKEIESLGSKSGIDLVDMKPAGTEQSGATKKYLINLNCEAEMEEFVDFLYNVETSNKLLTVEKFQVSPVSKDSSTARCKLTVSKSVIP